MVNFDCKHAGSVGLTTKDVDVAALVTEPIAVRAFNVVKERSGRVMDESSVPVVL
jgi:hypothetical protein